MKQRMVKNVSANRIKILIRYISNLVPRPIKALLPNSRINPTDDDQTLDDRASRKRLAHIATVNLIGQRCKGRNTNKVEDECNGHGNKMGDKAESIALTKELEAEC